MPITITLDLEDSIGVNAPDGRWVAATRAFLATMREADVRATVFVVGDAARSCPQLVREVAADGHEIALHGLHHVPLGASGPGRLLSELREGKALLEGIAQQPVEGFRAPIFSLTPATRWAVDELTEAGFRYSSSILPASNPLHGWPGLPTTPFRWSTGLLEFPCPVVGVGPARIPYLGGIYLRYVPRFLAQRMIDRLPADAAAWSYVHPYDLDPGAPVRRFPHASWPTSLLLHTRRRATMPRIQAMLARRGAAPALGDLARRLEHTTLPQVDAAA